MLTITNNKILTSDLENAMQKLYGLTREGIIDDDYIESTNNFIQTRNSINIYTSLKPIIEESP